MSCVLALAANNGNSPGTQSAERKRAEGKLPLATGVIVSTCESASLPVRLSVSFVGGMSRERKPQSTALQFATTTTTPS